MRKIQDFFKREHKTIGIFILIILGTFFYHDLAAQFGGGGGSGGSDSGGGDGLGELIFFLLMLLPFPYNYISVVVLLVGVFFFNKLKKQGSILNKIPSNKVPVNHNLKDLKAFKEMHPEFDESEFIAKTGKAFYDLQKAWSDKDISLVRRYISDGMYQRVNTQFKMMDLLDQTNPMEKLSLKKEVIDKIESDGSFDVIHVAIYASIKNKYVSGKYPNLNIPIYEEFVEYWSFIRKNGASGVDMYSTYNCPNCGGLLPNETGDVSKCPFCGTITNSGEYDWVLSEITQADDYVTTNYLHDLSDSLYTKLENIMDTDPDFSKQIIEDKASNGFLQIGTAKVYKNADIMKRFVSDELFTRLKLDIETGPPFVYNRIYINDVTLIGALQKDGNNTLAVYIRSSFQRVSIINGKATFIDNSVMSRQNVMLMTRDINFLSNKGSLYAYQCSSCGGALQDTTDMNCPYCGSLLNSYKHEWIITDIMTQESYLTYYKENSKYFVANIDSKNIDKHMKVRDYAFNNVLIMIATDGVFDDEEMIFARKLAKKYGYSTKKVEGLFDMAKNNKLVIKMPESAIEREKIYKLMHKAAAIDGNICSDEQKLLDDVKSQYPF
jgi:rubrerythrin